MSIDTHTSHIHLPTLVRADFDIDICTICIFFVFANPSCKSLAMQPSHPTSHKPSHPTNFICFHRMGTRKPLTVGLIFLLIVIVFHPGIYVHSCRSLIAPQATTPRGWPWPPSTSASRPQSSCPSSRQTSRCHLPKCKVFSP